MHNNKLLKELTLGEGRERLYSDRCDSLSESPDAFQVFQDRLVSIEQDKEHMRQQIEQMEQEKEYMRQQMEDMKQCIMA